MPPVSASITYLADIPLWQEETPFQLYLQDDTAPLKSNVTLVTHEDVQVHDLRSSDLIPTLEKDGFEVVKHSFKIQPQAREFQDAQSTVVIPFLQEIQSFLEDHMCAEKTLCFDWRVSSGPASIKGQGQHHASD